MNTATSLKEYVEIPIKELVESSTNPRKSFDEAALDELAESIRRKAFYHRCSCGRTATSMKSSPERGAFGAQSAGSKGSARLALDLTQDEVLEIQIIENVVRRTYIRSKKHRLSRLLDRNQALTPSRRSRPRRKSRVLHRQTNQVARPDTDGGDRIHRQAHRH